MDEKEFKEAGAVSQGNFDKAPGPEESCRPSSVFYIVYRTLVITCKSSLGRQQGSAQPRLGCMFSLEAGTLYRIGKQV